MEGTFAVHIRRKEEATVLEAVFYYAHYILLLAFGVILSFTFGGVRLLVKENLRRMAAVFILCGVLQLVAYVAFDEQTVWKLYPLITHTPIAAVLCLVYRKNIVTALAAVSSAYLCCQPSKWLGLLCYSLTDSAAAQWAVRSLALLAGGVVLCRLAPTLAQLFHKDKRSAAIFGSVPLVYYLYDYSMGIYTDLWAINDRVAAEFLPFFLCIAFLLFCFVYYKEYEQKADAESKEQIIRLTVEQQRREVEAVKRSENELRILRHDMRMLLSNLSLSIENDDRETARELISAYASYIEGTKVDYYCANTIVNYILTDFADKCKQKQVAFTCMAGVEELPVDEILFSSILSNALDNALNAQEAVEVGQRRVELMLKIVNDKLLLSVKNPTHTVPTFVDGLPLSDRKGHGCGTRSIRYMTERLGGHCQFSVQEGVFILRVVL